MHMPRIMVAVRSCAPTCACAVFAGGVFALALGCTVALTLRHTRRPRTSTILEENIRFGDKTREKQRKLKLKNEAKLKASANGVGKGAAGRPKFQKQTVSW